MVHEIRDSIELNSIKSMQTTYFNDIYFVRSRLRNLTMLMLDFGHFIRSEVNYYENSLKD